MKKHRIALLPMLAFAVFVPMPTLAREIGSSNDVSFVRQAHHADLLEEQLAKVALKRVGGSDTRTVAHMILKQDQTSEQVLRQATHESGLTPPKPQDVTAKAPRSALSFFAQDVKEKRAMAYVFKKEARHGDKPALRAYAQKCLPAIQGELIAVERDERRTAGIVPAKKPTEYTLPKPWPS
jgi:predicted outer membrane protein